MGRGQVTEGQSALNRHALQLVALPWNMATNRKQEQEDVQSIGGEQG
jgi:hypothetical protein